MDRSEVVLVASFDLEGLSLAISALKHRNDSNSGLAGVEELLWPASYQETHGEEKYGPDNGGSCGGCWFERLFGLKGCCFERLLCCYVSPPA